MADGDGRSRVVLIDDHEMLRSMYQRFLGEHDDLEVVAACATATEGIAAVERLDPDVAVIDLSLPDMAGTDAIALLRTRAPRTKVVVVSGADATSAAAGATAAGAVAYVDKIDAPRDLVATIRRVAAPDAG
jgi:DNA-binding NarL/FixJ family response regulator